MNKSPYRYPFLDLGRVNARYMADLKAAAARVIDSGRYVGGPEVKAFEDALAACTQVPYVVAVSNGLDALRLIFRAYIELGRLQPGDEVIVPANTYIASVLAVTDCGLKPVLVEPDPETLNLDTRLVEASISPRTKAILTVHLYGRVCYDQALKTAAERHKLLVIEDNAQAIGATSATPSPRGTYIAGSLGDAAAFSFYPTKNVGALGDAGAVATADAQLASTVRALANYGSDYRYHNIYQGVNCRMDPLQAAFLTLKLQDMDDEIQRRRDIAAIYSSAINNPKVITPRIDEPDRSVWHQYVVRTPYREFLRRHLEANGVETDIHYATPPHRQPCYPNFSRCNLPITEQLADEVLSLPISACTSATDAREIAAIINDFKL